MILLWSKMWAQYSQHFYCWIRKQDFSCCPLICFFFPLHFYFMSFSTGQFTSLFFIFEQLTFFCILLLTFISVASPSSSRPHRCWPHGVGVIQVDFCRCSNKKADTAVSSARVSTCTISYISAKQEIEEKAGIFTMDESLFAFLQAQ